MNSKVVFTNVLLYSFLNQGKSYEKQSLNLSMFYPHTTPMRPVRMHYSQTRPWPLRSLDSSTVTRPIGSQQNYNYSSTTPLKSTRNINFSATTRPIKLSRRITRPTRSRSMDSLVRPTSPTFFDTGIDGIPSSVFEDIFTDPRNKDPRRLNHKIDELTWYDEGPKATRRQQFMNPYAEGLPAMYTGEEYRCKRQILDNMLQLIYMARYKIRTLEKSRLASVSKQMQMFKIARAHTLISVQLKRLHIIMKLHEVNMFKWENISQHAILHHRAAKIHMDFLYMFWVMVKLQAAAKSFQERKVKRAQEKAARIRENMMKLMTSNPKKKSKKIV